MNSTGRELLQSARSPDLEDLKIMFGPRSGTADDLERPAVVATLLSDFTADDRDLIRLLAEFEIEYVRVNPSIGCGDTLLALCWLVFMLGNVDDSSLVWEAKNLNFDTFCAIDSIFLVPQGVDTTARYAHQSGHKDLHDYVQSDWNGDVSEGIENWRTATYWSGRPSPDERAQQLADWLRAP